MNDLTTGRASESQHWYDRAGRPVYEIENKSKPGTLRDVNLRDARKLGLVPGFSTIAQMEHKPQLERWKLEQMCLAALTLPTIEGEPLEERKKRVYIDSAAQAEKARERGTHLHSALQGFFEGAIIDSEDAPYVYPVVDWLLGRFAKRDWIAESSFAHPLGYGGKCDLRCDTAIVDFKFKDFGPDAIDKKFGYDEHEMQLAAYEVGFQMPPGVKLNLFISSTVPGLIVPVEWPVDNPHAFEAFRCLLRLWQIRKGFNSSWEP